MRTGKRGADRHQIGLPADLAHAVRDNMAVAWISPDGQIEDASDRFCDLMGYESGEMNGLPHEQLLEPKDRGSPEHAQFWDDLNHGKIRGDDAFPRIDGSGNTVWIGANYFPVMDEDGALRRIILFARDVTKSVRGNAEAQSRLDALDRSQARVEFDPDGTIRMANDNFLKVVGYDRDEIIGKHHRMFCDKDYVASPEYAGFWDNFAKGQHTAGEFRRVGKDGHEIWLQASYNPILGPSGNTRGVVKIASDITADKLDALLSQSRLDALSDAQAIIEFEPDGTIRDANENFLSCVGYAIEEIRGKHHRMFMPPDAVGTEEYARFWDELRQGHFQAGEFQRVGKNNREIWLQATYNPVADSQGKVFRVEKFANDITGSKTAIAAFQTAMSRLAGNDLAVRISDSVPPEFEALKSQFNQSMDALSTVIAGISERTDRILADAAQIESAADDLSVRTERQAATLEETAAALDQMAGSVRNAAASAEEAAATSTSAEDSTTTGLETVKRAVAAMNEIAESSNKVSRITDTIDALAFQTNLLALNAGVEAARAGETGRGFAVVASEVRQLAQRSSEASQEIADLIRATSSQIQSGVKLVDDSGGALERIAAFVGDIRKKVAGLAAAAQEQSRGLDDINAAAGELDKVTQQNAAMFEETTAATQSLKREVTDLSDSTRQFSLGDGADNGSWGDAADRAEARRSA